MVRKTKTGYINSYWEDISCFLFQKQIKTKPLSNSYHTILYFHFKTQSIIPNTAEAHTAFYKDHPASKAADEFPAHKFSLYA